MVGDEAIEAVVHGAPNLTRAAAELVERALDAGGHDNVTVVLVRMREDAGRAAGVNLPALVLWRT